MSRRGNYCSSRRSDVSKTHHPGPVAFPDNICREISSFAAKMCAPFLRSHHGVLLEEWLAKKRKTLPCHKAESFTRQPDPEYRPRSEIAFETSDHIFAFDLPHLARRTSAFSQSKTACLNKHWKHRVDQIAFVDFQPELMRLKNVL